MSKPIAHLSDLTPDPRNARAHNPRNVGLIESALNEVGAARSIVIDEDGVVLAGNATIEAAAQAGIERVQVVEADGETIIAVRRSGLTPEQKVKLALFDNRAAELADWNTEVLAELSAEIDLSDLFRDEEMAELLAGVGAPDVGGGGDEFQAEPEDGPTRTALGDLWSISGNGLMHRLVVGDCTDPLVVERLMGGERAQGTFTSPPYAEQRKERYGGVPADEYVDWFVAVQENIAAALAPDGSFFLNIKEHSEDIARAVYVHELVFTMARAWGWVYLDEFCWERVGVPGDPVKMGKFKNQWEPVFWFAKTIRPKFYPQRVMHASDAVILDENYQSGLERSQGVGRSVVGTRREGRGMAYPGNRIRGGNAEAMGHAAAFPVSLPTFFIEAYSDKGDIWLDPFAGSGTVLSAAHAQGRRAFLVELLPRHADICLARAEAAGLTCTRVGE